MRRLVLVVLLAVAIGGCRDKRKEAIDKVDHDAEALKRASGAVSQVIRNSTDCAAAKPLIPEAYQRIEEARTQVTTQAMAETVNALKIQVDRIAQLCP